MLSCNGSTQVLGGGSIIHLHVFIFSLYPVIYIFHHPFPVESGVNFVIGAISTKVAPTNSIVMASFKNVSFFSFVSDHLTMKKNCEDVFFWIL